MEAVTTGRIQLVPIKLLHVLALSRDRSELAALLDVSVPASWPFFPEAFQLPPGAVPDASAFESDWPGLFFIHPAMKTLVGSGGFKGGPDDAGVVEIGYEIASEYWNRGFGTEAARGMADIAFSRAEVQVVMAHTLAETNASNRILQKLGMKFVAEIVDPDDGPIWRWHLSRAEYEAR